MHKAGRDGLRGADRLEGPARPPSTHFAVRAQRQAGLTHSLYQFGSHIVVVSSLPASSDRSYGAARHKQLKRPPASQPTKG